MPHSRMHRAIIQLFENTLTGSLPSFSPQGRTGAGNPQYAVDVSATDDAVVVEMELPGVTLGDVAVQVEGDILMVKGERKEEARKGSRIYYREESQYGHFERKIALPMSGLSGQVEVALANGILKVTLPKPLDAKATPPPRPASPARPPGGSRGS